MPHRRLGRPRYPSPLTLRCSQRLRVRLRAVARRLGLVPSEAHRRALELGLDVLERERERSR